MSWLATKAGLEGRRLPALLAGVLALSFATATSLQAQDDADAKAEAGVEPPGLRLPTLTVGKGVDKAALELRSLSVDVQFEGWFAETVLELDFYNHTKRRQEGEFVLQLPPDATVSTYALEVNGEMRVGVAVEKSRARNAYESIKRRQVDPGLVEREEGNVYRTRIFPIEPESTKRVRIGFVHALGKEGKYTLPLHSQDRIAKFSCQLNGYYGLREKPALTPLPDGIDSPKRDYRGWIWKGKDVRLNECELTAMAEIAYWGPKKQIARQADGSAHFLIQGKHQADLNDDLSTARRERLSWRKVRLLWDGSYSGRWRDRDKEYAALKQLWDWAGDCEVTLQVVGYRIGDPQKFTLSGRDGGTGAEELEQVLRAVKYDGAADYSQIDKWGEEDGVTLLVGDGKIGSPLWAPQAELADEKFYLMLSAGIAAKVDPQLMAVVTRRIDLDGEVGGENARWLRQFAGAAAGIEVTGAVRGDFDVSASKGWFAVSGRLPAEFSSEVKVQIAGIDVATISRQEVYEADLYDKEEEGKSRWNLVRRIWAQRRLASLEGQADGTRIREFAEAERLVSDYTSLIVLELMADHVRYRIPPPEPALLEEYQRSIEDKDGLTHRRLDWAWRQKLVWHRTEFPWVDADLEHQISIVSAWTQASRVAFTEQTLNEKEVKSYEAWLDKARKVTQAKSDLSGSEEFRKWSQQLEKRTAELATLRKQPPRLPKKSAPIHVSVRGFVNERGIFSGTPEGPEALTLERALERAGGPNYFGSWSRVYLYRDAQRTGYNLRSDQYIDVPLQWGDMVVMESQPYGYGNSSLGGGGSFSNGRGPVDPFSSAPVDGFAAPSGTGGAAPVFEEAGANTVPVESFRRPFGPPSDDVRGARDKAAERPSLNASISAGGPLTLPKGVDWKLIGSLREHKNPVAFYSDLMAGDFGKQGVSVASVIEIARVFFARDLDEAGRLVLSNLTEIRPNLVEATREMSYWLAEFGQSDLGVDFLEVLSENATDEATRALLNFDTGRVSGEAEPFGAAVEAVLASGQISALASISLTDYFGRGGRVFGQLATYTRHGMASDVRVVVTSVGEDLRLTPADPSLQLATGFAPRDKHGGRQVGSDRVQEYQMRRALPGKYRFLLGRRNDETEPITVRVDFFLNWNGGSNGTAKPQHESVTLLFDGREHQLPDLEFGWDEEKDAADEK